VAHTEISSIDGVRKNCSLALIVLGCAAGLLGCGSSATQRGQKHTSGSASTQASAASSTGANDNGEAAKPAGRILADAAAALRNAHGYVMRGTITQDGEGLRLNVAVAKGGSMHLALGIGRADLDVIKLSSASYLRANKAYWTAHLGARGAVLANRWIQVQASNAQELTSSLGHFAPATVSRCLVEDHGSLTVAGKTMVDGHPAVIIKDAGNAPGASPGSLAVATSGVPYPLQLTGAGRQRPGGRIDVCNDGKASYSRGTLTFSQFGAVAPISPPADAIHPGPALST
jgi:hypothetical protein